MIHGRPASPSVATCHEASWTPPRSDLQGRRRGHSAPVPPIKVDIPDTDMMGDSESCDAGGSGGGGASKQTPFIKKTYAMVEDLHTNHVISWLPCGSAFVVESSDVLAIDVLPLFFKHGNFASFVRQLHFYGFSKASLSNGSSEFRHPNFLRGRPDLLHLISRKSTDTITKQKSQIDDLQQQIHFLREQNEQLMIEHRRMMSLVAESQANRVAAPFQVLSNIAPSQPASQQQQSAQMASQQMAMAHAAQLQLAQMSQGGTASSCRDQTPPQPPAPQQQQFIHEQQRQASQQQFPGADAAAHGGQQNAFPVTPEATNPMIPFSLHGGRKYSFTPTMHQSRRNSVPGIEDGAFMRIETPPNSTASADGQYDWSEANQNIAQAQFRSMSITSDQFQGISPTTMFSVTPIAGSHQQCQHAPAAGAVEWDLATTTQIASEQ